MKLLRNGGPFTRRRVRFCLTTSLGLLVSTVAVVGFSYSSDRQAVSLFMAACLLVLLAASFRRWTRWWRRNKGQDIVTETLKSLADDYVVLNDIVLPGSKGHVDYLVIGINGIFAVEIQNCSGLVKCEADEWFINRRWVRSLSKQAKRNTIAVRGYVAQIFTGSPTSIPYIAPLLVFVRSSARLKLLNPTVPVLRLGQLVEFIRAHETKQPITLEEKRAMVQHLQLLQRNFAYLSDAPASEAEPLDKAG
jgi:hypothetical protein